MKGIGQFWAAFWMYPKVHVENNFKFKNEMMLAIKIYFYVLNIPLTSTWSLPPFSKFGNTVPISFVIFIKSLSLVELVFFRFLSSCRRSARFSQKNWYNFHRVFLVWFCFDHVPILCVVFWSCNLYQYIQILTFLDQHNSFHCCW